MFGTIHYIILLIRHVLQCLTPNHKTVLAVSHILNQFKSHGNLYAISEEQSSTYHPSQSILIFPVPVIIWHPLCLYGVWTCHLPTISLPHSEYSNYISA